MGRILTSGGLLFASGGQKVGGTCANCGCGCPGTNCTDFDGSALCSGTTTPTQFHVTFSGITYGTKGACYADSSGGSVKVSDWPDFTLSTYVTVQTSAFIACQFFSDVAMVAGSKVDAWSSPKNTCSGSPDQTLNQGVGTFRWVVRLQRSNLGTGRNGWYLLIEFSAAPSGGSIMFFDSFVAQASNTSCMNTLNFTSNITGTGPYTRLLNLGDAVALGYGGSAVATPC